MQWLKRSYVTIYLQVIPTGFYKNCETIYEITIPESVTTIEENAFFDCENLWEINIPDSVTEIGGGAFSYTPWCIDTEDKQGFVIVNDILLSAKDKKGKIVIPKGGILTRNTGERT